MKPPVKTYSYFVYTRKGDINWFGYKGVLHYERGPAIVDIWYESEHSFNDLLYYDYDSKPEYYLYGKPYSYWDYTERRRILHKGSLLEKFTLWLRDIWNG